MKIIAAQKMPDRHFYLLRHHILFYIYFWFSVYWCQIEINILIWRKRSLSRRLWVYDFCILNTLRSRRWIWYFFFFLTILNLQLVRMGIFQKALAFTAIFLWRIFLWLTLIIFWAIPFSFQQKSIICYQNQTAAEIKFYAEL